jgi:peptidoglycan/LPS O-acetylase OafA/YrhL
LQKLSYIDGLRGLAVTLVVLYHAETFGVLSGYLGVDLFFVISGFVITRTILYDIDRGEFSIARFFERRARRILPALYLVMAICLCLTFWLLLPGYVERISKSVLSTLGFVSNIFFWREGNYFGSASDFKPLLHTWSLGVEEQFYLIFPVLMSVSYVSHKSRRFGIILALFLLSMGIYIWGGQHHQVASFYLLPTRAWELLAGSLIAIKMHRKAGGESTVLSALGLGIILACAILDRSFFPLGSLQNVTVVAGCLLVIWNTQKNSLVDQILSSRVFIFLGILSFGVYLWHQPVFVFYRFFGGGDLSFSVAVLLIVATISLAAISWFFVENPIRKSRRLATTRAFCVTFIAISIALAGMAGFGVLTGGKVRPLSENEKQILGYLEYPSKQYYLTGECLLETGQNETHFTNRCFQSDRIFVVGDSHAAALASGIRASMDITQLTSTLCPMIDQYSRLSRPNCASVTEFVLGKIQSEKPEYVIFHSNWSAYNTKDFGPSCLKQ